MLHQCWLILWLVLAHDNKFLIENERLSLLLFRKCHNNLVNSTIL